MFTPAELCLIAAELHGLCTGARIRNVHQPTAESIVLKLGVDGDDLKLFLSASRRFPRAHLLKATLTNPRIPPRFCEELRSHITGSKITAIRAVPHDRILIIELDARDAEGAAKPLRLRAHLFGSKPDLLLTDGRDQVLAGLRGNEGRYAAGTRVETTPHSDDSATNDVAFASFGPDFAPSALIDGCLSEAIESWVAPLEVEASIEEVRTELARDLRDARKKQERILRDLGEDLKKLDLIPQLRREGELLKSQLHAVKRGAREAVVTDWETGEQLKIKLDPKRTAHEEVSARFDEMHRLTRSGDAVRTRQGIVDDRVAAIDRLLAGVDKAMAVADVADLRREAERVSALRPRQVAPKSSSKAKAAVEARKAYHTFVSKDGLEIWVGRGAKDNDELTFKVAAGNDWWLHVRDYPGSHIVIRDTKSELPEQTLLDAATLAVHFSKADSGGKRDVSWTRRKYVSKPRGAPPGQVLLSTHKTIHLRADPERLARLLNRDLPKR